MGWWLMKPFTSACMIEACGEASTGRASPSAASPNWKVRASMTMVRPTTTEAAIPPRNFTFCCAAGVVVSAIAVAVFFGTLKPTIPVLVAGLLLTLVFSFFFTSVAANAIATTARNPVSGMTMLTIIISSVVLLNFGLSGTTGMFFVMAIAGMVCTALSMSGQTITDLKTGYWLGSTPAAQQKVKFLGGIAASVVVGLTIVLLARTFQFGEAAEGDLRPVLASPQASIMQALVKGFMSHQPIAYALFGTGMMVTLLLEMV